MKCGLLGRKLGHSYSPQIHAMLGSYSYALFEKEPEEIEAFLKCGDWAGINVTVPYKKSVIPYLDELTPTAEKLGAVNVIVRRNGRLIGHNTDFFGFQTMLNASKLDISGKKALVLGSGGASNTVCAVLNDAGAEVVIISRSGENNYTNLHLHKDAALIVNTTPVGMYPNTGIAPVDLEQFPNLQGVLDVVYNPARTKLLLDAEKNTNLVCANGLLMLVAQAKEAAEWFTDASISDDVIEPILHTLENQMQNIILIGMPGCGKTTIGKLLAESTGKAFVDSDEQIVALAGKSIPEIFADDGEAVFRDWETTALAQLAKQSGLVIATGGGCVTRECNYSLLHQNGRIFWLQRDLNLLPVDGRPLSQANKLEVLYKIRKPMYEAFADHTVSNRNDPDCTVRQILRILEGAT